MKYRSRTDIAGSILMAAMSGANKTRLMYQCYLSYAQLKEYLAFLEGNELLEHDDKTHLYRITAKGERFMRDCEEIKALIAGV